MAASRIHQQLPVAMTRLLDVGLALRPSSSVKNWISLTLQRPAPAGFGFRSWDIASLLCVPCRKARMQRKGSCIVLNNKVNEGLKGLLYLLYMSPNAGVKQERNTLLSTLSNAYP